MADFYVDLTNGSDAANGSQAAPYKTFQPINAASAWARGNAIYVKRGSRGIVNSTTRANIEVQSGSGRLLLSAYGDPLAPMPVVDAGGAAFNPIWVRSGSALDIEFLHATNGPGDLFSISPITGQNISDIEVRDCLATYAGQNSTLLGVDGFKWGMANLDGGTLTSFRGKRLVARDCGGHGMKARGRATGGSFERCVAIRCGQKSPSHGMGTAGHFTNAVGGWTNVSGNVWERPTTAPLISSVTSWFGCWVIGASPLYRLPYSATPATPGVGECGIGAANTLRINLGGQDPNTLTSAFAVWARPDSVHFSECVASATVDANGLEGDGIYFDNGSIRCYSHNCWGLTNQGRAHYLNDCIDSGHYGGGGYLNLKAGAQVVRGYRTRMDGNVYYCFPGTRGLEYTTGNDTGKANRNVVIGATVGIWTNDSGTNSVAEDANVFIGCATRLQNVATPGSASVDRTAITKNAGGSDVFSAFRRIAAAERVA